MDSGGASSGEDYSIEDKFILLSQSGVFDYIETSPAEHTFDEYLRCSKVYSVPIKAGGGTYRLGAEEHVLEKNTRSAQILGSETHNIQLLSHHTDGHLLSNEEVAQAYISAYKLGIESNCLPTFEVHVDIWSEDYSRVLAVADLVEAKGIPFGITLDHSHIVFKIDNPEQQKVFGIDRLIQSKAAIIDPFMPNNVYQQWLDRGIVWHMHARSTVPNNPVNSWAKHPNGNYGRDIQYPFIAPGVGQWHSVWDGILLSPWKQVVLYVLRDF